MSTAPNPPADILSNVVKRGPLPTDQETINLRVCEQDGTEVYFKIKKTTQLRRLMDAYVDRKGINPNSLRFLFDGSRIRPEQTPKELEMEDNDIIDAVLQQTGGL